MKERGVPYTISEAEAVLELQCEYMNAYHRDLFAWSVAELKKLRYGDAEIPVVVVDVCPKCHVVLKNDVHICNPGSYSCTVITGLDTPKP